VVLNGTINKLSKEKICELFSRVRRIEGN
jgi:hypothetical protein